MDSTRRRQLIAILSTLISQITLIIILLYNNNDNSQFSESDSNFQTLISLVHHFLSSSETLTLCLLTQPKKRTRPHLPESHSDQNPVSTFPKLARLERVDSVIVKDPDSFRLFFKMTPSTFEWLSGLLEPLLECRDPVNLNLDDLSAELRLGIGLFRLATGSSYDELATRFRVSERVAKFCTKQLCRVLCTNFRFWVEFPNQTEVKPVSSNFEELTGLPNCCGVIGCTRFAVRKSSNEKQEVEETVSAQIVVDSSCRILSIVAGHDGKKSKNEILKSSTLYTDIESGILLNGQKININNINVGQYLIGEKGYSLLSWLITPFDESGVEMGSNEEKFNEIHGVITRVSIRKTVASLKRWGILSKVIEEGYRDGVGYIASCAILHNALLLREDFSGLCSDDLVNDDDGGGDGGCGGVIEENLILRNVLAMKAKNLSSFSKA